MAENSKIEWTDHTFNPWIGCTMVAPECTNCYAKTLMDDRYKKAKWGPNGTRVLTARLNWKQPHKWDKDAARDGVKRRVFCASLADVFEDDRKMSGTHAGVSLDLMLGHARAALWELIEETPNLIWLLLTKRPQNIRAMVPPAWLLKWPENVWTGTSAGCQATADANIPPLLAVPGPHFLSCGPMLGAVDLTRIDATSDTDPGYNALTYGPDDEGDLTGTIKWVICEGESGPNARPMHPDHARGLRDQCAAAGVAFFFKQWGEWLPVYDRDVDDPDWRNLPKKKDNGQYLNLAGGQGFSAGKRVVFMERVGKRAAGRMLDGVTHDGLPEAFTAKGASA